MARHGRAFPIQPHFRGPRGIGIKNAYYLTADPGALSLTGDASALNVARTLTAAPGALTLSGDAAALGRLYTLNADPGAITLTGDTAAVLNRAVTLSAAAGSLTLAGGTATLQRALTMTADPGAIVLSAADATFNFSLVMGAQPGALTLTGDAATFDVGAVTPPTPTPTTTSVGHVPRRRKYHILDLPVRLTAQELDAHLERLLADEPETLPSKQEIKALPREERAIARAVPAYIPVRNLLLERQQKDALERLRVIAAQMAFAEDEREVEMLLLH